VAALVDIGRRDVVQRLVDVLVVVVLLEATDLLLQVPG
jgi:hypothetical protein